MKSSLPFLRKSEPPVADPQRGENLLLVNEYFARIAAAKENRDIGMLQRINAELLDVSEDAPVINEDNRLSMRNTIALALKGINDERARLPPAPKKDTFQTSLDNIGSTVASLSKRAEWLKAEIAKLSEELYQNVKTTEALEMARAHIVGSDENRPNAPAA